LRETELNRGRRKYAERGAVSKLAPRKCRAARPPGQAMRALLGQTHLQSRRVIWFLCLPDGALWP